MGTSLALASAGYSLGHLELQENTLAFFACLVRVLAEAGAAAAADLAGLVTQLAPLTLEILFGSEGVEVVRDGPGEAERIAEHLHALRSEQGQWCAPRALERACAATPACPLSVACSG